MTHKMISRGRCLATVLMVLAPSVSCAQADRDSIAARNQCKRVEQIFKTGSPKADLMWAVNAAPDCGLAGAQQGAQLVRRLAQVTTPAEEEAALYLAAQVRSAELFDAGMYLVTDASNPRVRTVGFVIALRQYLPGMGWTVDALEQARPGRRCATGYISASEPDVLTPLASGARELLENSARSIVQSATSASLRNAAGCVVYELELTKDSLPDGVEFDPRR